MNDNLTSVPLSNSIEPRVVRGRHGNSADYAFTIGHVTVCSSRLTRANQHGFTLLEIIVSVVVMSIIAVIAGVGFLEISKGYMFSKKNALTTQQGQIAMARLKKELSNMQSVTSGSANSITYKRCSDSSPPCGTLKDVTIFWDGGGSPISINGDILVGPVYSFSITFCDFYNPCPPPTSIYSTSTSIIEITLQLQAAEGTPVILTDRVNLYQETGG